MKRLAMLIIGSVTLLAGLDAGKAEAQNAPLKGRWLLTLQTSIGTFQVPTRFKHDGEGEMTPFTDPLPLVYREVGATFSISVEVTAAESPNGQPFTLLLRGFKTTDDVLQGTGLVITDIPDPLRPASDPVRVIVQPVHVSGTRE